MDIQATKSGGHLHVVFNDRVQVSASSTEMKGKDWQDAFWARCKSVCADSEFASELSDDDLEAFAEAIKGA